MEVSGKNPVKNRLPAFKLVQSSRRAWRLANLLLAFLIVCTIAMLFAPWQQSAKGTGQVVAYVPQERQQTVLSPSKGVVVRIAEGLREGMRVKQGEFILELEPTAANLRDQLQRQIHDLDAKMSTSQIKSEVYARNIVDFQAAQVAVVSGADELIDAAKAKWDAELKLLPGYEAKEHQAKLNYERQKGLAEKGIKASVEIEKFKKDWDVAKAELDSLKLKIDSVMEEWQAKKSERIQKEREAKTKVDYARAMEQDALGQLATVHKEKRDLEIKSAELERLDIYAPRDGVIFRLPIFERGQTLKEGDPLFTIVPDAKDRIVELWISGNDMPLVRNGDHVRLQFEGWPAVQFAGWPSVAVGTFGGEVAAIDPSDDGKGNFRIQVKPTSQLQWPADRYLRQGVRANGWVMLSQVTVGYEIWRQLNGFPPVISPDEPDSESKDYQKKKKVPLPK